MDNFKTIYLILRALENGMDERGVDKDAISPEALGISEERFNKLLVAMEEDGYIAGVEHINTLAVHTLRYDRMRITIKGMEYLADNHMMKKAYRAIKGIRDLI